MRLNKIIALLYRDFLILRRSPWRLVDITYFPITTILIWGFFSLYSKAFSTETGAIVLIIVVFWNFAYITQSTANMQMLEDMWSGSLKQLLLSGISEIEYITARLVMSAVVSSVVLFMMIIVSSFFDPRLLIHITPLIQIGLLTLVVSLAVAILVSALIVSLGKSYAFLAWSALQALILLSAPFFPKEIFPGIISTISNVMPYTYIFEAARNISMGNPISLANATIVTIIYFIIAWPIYIYLFKIARKNGNLAKLS